MTSRYFNSAPRYTCVVLVFLAPEIGHALADMILKAHVQWRKSFPTLLHRAQVARQELGQFRSILIDLLRFNLPPK